MLEADVIDLYPHLIPKLTLGFPLGPIPLPTTTHTPDNLSSLDEYTHIAKEWIDEEISLGRMAGPFSRDALEAKIGPFQSSPLQMVSKVAFPGAPPKVRTCVNLSYRGGDLVINDHIDSDDFPTRWGSFRECASLVRLAE
jgi:hypothetical protein